MPEDPNISYTSGVQRLNKTEEQIFVSIAVEQGESGLSAKYYNTYSIESNYYKWKEWSESHNWDRFVLLVTSAINLNRTEYIKTADESYWNDRLKIPSNFKDSGKTSKNSIRVSGIDQISGPLTDWWVVAGFDLSPPVKGSNIIIYIRTTKGVLKPLNRFRESAEANGCNVLVRVTKSYDWVPYA